MNPIEDYELFIALVETSSFNKAADRLGTSTSGVSRHLKKLEQKMGVQLMHRTTRSLSLTQAGTLLYESCRRIEEETRTTRSLIDNLTAKPVGQLKITATPTFAQALLMDALAAFATEFPDISLQLELTDEYLDIVEKGIDVAFRIGNLKDSRLKSRHLFSSSLRVCATPGYLAARGKPETPEQLAEHCFLYIKHLPAVERRQQQQLPDLIISEQQKKLVVNDVRAMHQAALAGMGITLLPDYLIQPDIDSGRLTELFPGLFQMPHEVYLLFQSAHYIPLKTRAFIDYMAKYFGQKPAKI